MERTDKIILNHVSFRYGKNLILDNINMTIAENAVTAITGPSGQGKTTFLGLLNRLWDDIPGAAVEGEINIKLDDKWISPLKNNIPMPLLRRKVGTIFQEPNPLPMSIIKNMAFPLKLAGIKDKSIVQMKVQKALEQAFLWDEVKNRLETSAEDLSGGQKQRLCIARALVLEPEVLLCDEPTSSLDKNAASVIEELLIQLKSNCTLLVVSHDIEQVHRIADFALEIQDRKIKEI